MDEHQALKVAVQAAVRSPCAKSKRGVVIWRRSKSTWATPSPNWAMKLGVIVSAGFNHPPKPFRCDGSVECKMTCNKLCIHAEEHAFLQAHRDLENCEMLHVKTDGRKAIASGGPSCWQCSRMILDSGITHMWLLHKDGLKAYTPEEFHRLTLEACGLPIIK